jgi:hypothetical protein
MSSDLVAGPAPGAAGDGSVLAPVPNEPRRASLVTGNLRQSGIYIAFVAIVALFTFLTDGVLLSPGNITNLVLQYSYILVLAIGMVIVIIAGHIDLSVGSVVALTGAVSAVLVIRNGQPWWVGVLAAIAVGLVVGAWQGFWVAYVGIPAFIVTLAGMLLFRGLTLQVLNNVSLSPFPSEYSKIASGFDNGRIGGNGYDAFTLLIFGLAVAGYAVYSWRTRAAKQRYDQPVESGAAVRAAGPARGLGRHGLRLAAVPQPRPAVRPAHPGRADPGLLDDHPELGLRPAGVRHRRQPQRRPAVRREGQEGQLLDLREHGLPRRDRRRASSPRGPTAPSPARATCSSSTRSPRRSSAARPSPAASARRSAPWSAA